MGITFANITLMSSLGLLKSGMSVMDIGSSNLYSATREQILGLWERFAAPGDVGERQKRAEAMAEGSYYDCVTGGRNGAWVGELFERCGFSYQSIDIAKGYKTTVFDLNAEEAPDAWKSAFDLVLNFGTMEHVLNQENAFRVIHDLTRPGGCMMHQLPVGGHTDHGYVVYTMRFFMDLARSNDYEVVYVSVNEGGRRDILPWIHYIGKYFPAFAKITPREPLVMQNLGLAIVLRKKGDERFRTCLETTTSVTLKEK